MRHLAPGLALLALACGDPAGGVCTLDILQARLVPFP